MNPDARLSRSNIFSYGTSVVVEVHIETLVHISGLGKGVATIGHPVG